MQNKNELTTANTLSDIVTAGLVQRVDLARFIPKQQKIYLSFNQILQICAILLMVVLGYSLYGYWERAALNRQITSLQLQSTKLVEQISSDRLRKMQELVGSEAIYTLLQAERVSNSPGFSNYLTAIAAACPNGVWLTSIEIKKRSNSMILAGDAYHSNNIMQLVDNLNRESLFSRSPFFLAKIAKVKEQAATNDKKISPKVIYNFTLRTQATAGPKT